MSKFSTTLELLDYSVTVEIGYDWSPLRQNRDSGQWEGGVEVTGIKVIAGYSLDDDGAPADAETLERLNIAAWNLWEECQAEAEDHYLHRWQASREAWAEIRAGY